MKFLSDILAKAGLVVDGVVTLNNVAAATTDTDKFVVIDNGVVKYRTGAQLLSDIGALSAESDTLDSVTTRGNTTTNSISIAGLTMSGNLTTTNQWYGLASNFPNGIFSGWDAAAVYLGYSMGATPIHIGSNGTGNVVIKTTGNLVLDYGHILGGTQMGLYPSLGYYEFGSSASSVYSPIVVMKNAYTGSEWAWYAGDPTYTGVLLYKQSANSTEAIYWDLDRTVMPYNSKIVWGSTTGILPQVVTDIGISRDSANTLQINNGTIGQYANLKALGATFTGLAGSGVRMVVADANGVLSVQALPTTGPATTTTLGSIIVGAGLSITVGGTLSVNGTGTARLVETFTASAGQTTFTVAQSYTVGLVDVFLNGVRLSSSAFTATDGTTIVLADAAVSGDIIDVVKYTPLSGYAFSTDNVPEGSTNLYFTNARARAAISLTTTGTTGAATYNSTTGVLNIPQYNNIYTADGTLTGNRSVSLNNNKLYFSGGQVQFGATTTPNLLSLVQFVGSTAFTKSIALTSTWDYQTSFSMGNGIYSAEFNLGGSSKNTNEGGPGSLQVATYNATTGVTRYPVTFFANGNVAFGGSGNTVLTDSGEALQVRGDGKIAGNLGVNLSSTISASAILQADSTTKGFLPPRMTAAQKTAISSPAIGLVIYQTDGVEGLWAYTSSGWKALAIV